jgi:dolichol-phosphate mannosyltransferase
MDKKIVIIPTYNEKENAEDIVRYVFASHDNFDILIIDDGSPDGTADIIKRLQKEFSERLYLIERNGKLGLGTAYITGFKWCLAKDYDYICEMDADFSHNPKDLEKLYLACKEDGAELSIGSRYVKGVNVVNWPMSRVLLSYFASKYVRIITGIPVHDTTAGFACYSKKALTKLDLDLIKFVGYAFQIEMKFSIWRLGLNLKEIPIVFTDREKGSSKMSGGIIKEAVWGVISMKIRSFFKSYAKEPKN